MNLPATVPVQWVEKFSASADTTQGRRILWGRVASGVLRAGQQLSVMPGGRTATVVEVLNHARRPAAVSAGQSAGVILDHELDVSRGDWLIASDEFKRHAGSREITVTLAWMDDEALVPGRVYWLLHGHRWVKAKVRRIVSRLDIATLRAHPAEQLPANAIGEVELSLQEPLFVKPFKESRVLGSLILVDTASHRTSAAALVL